MLQLSQYDFKNPGWSSGSGLFTQMVWRDTKAVGCAVNTACTWALYVCHYSPPGKPYKRLVQCSVIERRFALVRQIVCPGPAVCANSGTPLTPND